ncbi:MAG: hypothetical protein J7K46_12295 [Bacteroidales bacterium]|nr:hypothetical protein [Bacteroidales bacterium]
MIRAHVSAERVIGLNKIQTLFRKLLWTDLTTLVLCMLLYAGQFHFWHDAFSFLGTSVTPDHRPNTLSMLLFMAGLVMSSGFVWQMSAVFRTLPCVPNARLKSRLLQMTGIGFILMMFPCNINNGIHSTGSALVFGTLWLMTVLMLQEMKKSLRNRYLLFQFFLQGTVLPYAITYITGAASKQIFQKIAVAGLTMVMSKALRLSRMLFMPSDSAVAYSAS